MDTRAAYRDFWQAVMAECVSVHRPGVVTDSMNVFLSSLPVVMLLAKSTNESLHQHRITGVTEKQQPNSSQLCFDHDCVCLHTQICNTISRAAD